MGLIKTAEEILGGRPRPVDVEERKHGKGGRPPLHRGCKLPGCVRKHWGHGFCRPHGRKFLLYGDPLWVPGMSVTCVCIRCPVHRPEQAPFKRPERYTSTSKGKRGRPPRYVQCQVPGCSRPHHGNGMCKSCNRKAERWGDPLHVYVPTGSGRCGCDKHRSKL